MDAIEAPDGFELETWVEMVGHRESFPYYHYYKDFHTFFNV